MSRYGYLEVFQRVTGLRDNESLLFIVSMYGYLEVFQSHLDFEITGVDCLLCIGIPTIFL